MWLGIVLFALALAGCGPGIRQDRSITWTSEGEAVGFQHNEEGIFVADKDGGQLEKIFQPDPDVLASSTPLWSPTDRRLIFTTAKDPNQPSTPRHQLNLEFNPDGDVYWQRPIVYTCWLREAPQPGQAVPPTALFEAPCNHPGYVAANLAVRWHPRGDRLLYVKQIGWSNRHGLFEYDLAAKTSRRISPPSSAEALVFDWTPDGSHLVCVLADGGDKVTSNGIWIGNVEREEWWRVPHSEDLAEGQPRSLLEQARALQPVWTKDGSRFAFTTFQAGKTPKEPGRCSLWLGTVAGRQVQRVAGGGMPFRDLHWMPDGSRLGVLCGRATGSLHLIDDRGELSASINREPVRRFAGWNATGEQLAYVVPDKVPQVAGESWAFLLTPDALARDAVYVAHGVGTDPGREVFSGMRVTFPRWSPKEDKLSVWFTFSPTHRWLLSAPLGAGLRYGDPAVIFHPKTRQINWMAVNAFEKAQIGHYHLLKRRYEEAWKWYQEAEAGRVAPRQPLTPEQEMETVITRRDFTFFEYYCLSKLGRDKEARAKLEQFQRLFLAPPAGAPSAPAGTNPGQQNPQAIDRFTAALLMHFYVAEVFLSLDAVDDSRVFFQQALTAAKTDEECLVCAAVLAQLLLLEKKHAEYAELATDTLRPLMVKLWKPGTEVRTGILSVLDAAGLLGQTVLPLYDPKFLATLGHNQLEALLPRWREYRTKAADDWSRLTADRFLEAAYRTLGRENELQQVTARIRANPARGQFLTKDVAELVEEARQQRKQIEELRQWLTGR
jgi:hypothetical protein